MTISYQGRRQGGARGAIAPSIFGIQQQPARFGAIFPTLSIWKKILHHQFEILKPPLLKCDTLTIRWTDGQQDRKTDVKSEMVTNSDLLGRGPPRSITRDIHHFFQVCRNMYIHLRQVSLSVQVYEKLLKIIFTTFKVIKTY